MSVVFLCGFVSSYGIKAAVIWEPFGYKLSGRFYSNCLALHLQFVNLSMALELYHGRKTYYDAC